MKKLKTIGLFVLAFGFFAGSVLFTRGALKAADPSGVHVTLYKTELFADKSASPVVVFDNPAGKTVDIVNSPNDVFGQGTIPAGTYKRVKFTVKNGIDYTGTVDLALCTNETSSLVNDTMLITSGLGADASTKVGLYFATSDDGGSGSGWMANGSSATPFLVQNPIEVKANKITVVKFVFNTAGTLVCNSGTGLAQLLAPTMNVVNTYVEPPLACASSFPQQYWFATFAIYNSLFDEPNPISNPTMTIMLQKTGVISRWGTVTINKPDAGGNGTIDLTLNTTYDDQTTPGVALHMHTLGVECLTTEPGCMDGYFNPADALASDPTMTVNYTLTGGKLVVYKPNGGQVEGYLSDDCSAFVSVDISGKKENELTFGLKKPFGMANSFSLDTKFAWIGPGFSIHYDTNQSSPYPADSFRFGATDMVISASTGSNLRTFSLEWRSDILFSPLFNNGKWSSPGPAEWASADTGTDLASGPTQTIRPDGLITRSTDTTFDQFWAFGANGSLITASTTTDVDKDNNHRIGTGMWIQAHPSPSYNDISGNWIIAGLHAQVGPGANGWNSGDEVPQFGMVYGRMTIDGSARTFSTLVTFREAFTGEIYQHSVTGTVELRTDCYAYDPATGEGLVVTTQPASCIINGIQGFTLPVFYLTGTDQDGNLETTKIVLDASKKLIGGWNPQDSNGIPERCGFSTSCDPAPFAGAGIGIKVP